MNSGASPEFRSFDFTAIHPRDVYRLLVEAVVPRPIAFVSTVNSQGQGNLAPFSFYNAVSSNPPAVMFSCTPKRDGSPKDTLRNILETGQFVVNSANEGFAAALNQSSAEYPYGVDEMRALGLTAAPSSRVKPHRLLEASVQMECELLQTVPIGSGPGSVVLVIGKILMMHANTSVLTTSPVGESIAIGKYQPLSRLGGALYARTPEEVTFELSRPMAPETSDAPKQS